MSRRLIGKSPVFARGYKGVKKITADELYEMIEGSPYNDKAGSVAVMRSGRMIAVHSSIDLNVLVEKINERMAK